MVKNTAFPFIAVVIFSLHLTACHHGGVGAVLDSEVHSVSAVDGNLSKLQNMVVSVPVDDLMFRIAFEEQLVSKISGSNMKVYQYTKIFPPVKKYTDQEIKKVLSDLQVQAMLVVDVQSDNETQFGVATKGESVSPGAAWGNSTSTGVFVQGVTSTQSNSASTAMSKRVLKATVTLYDISTQEKIWIAGMVTKAGEGSRKGSGITADHYIAEIAAARISEKLSRDGLVRKKKSPVMEKFIGSSTPKAE
jgi:hypothetical protein